MTKRATLALPVADLATSLTFYIEQLGFKLATHAPDADLAHVIDPDGDAFLLAGPRAGDVGVYLDDQQRIIKAGETIRFSEADLDTRRRALQQRGLDAPQIVETTWGERLLTIADPDGVLLTFLTPAQHTDEEVLAMFVQGPDNLSSALAGLGEVDLELSLTPATWTIRQTVQHIADGEIIFLHAIKAALAEPGRAFVHNWPGSNEAYVAPDYYAHRPIAPTIELFRAMRAHIRQLIEYTPDAWGRAVHGADGQEWTVRRMVDIKTSHALEHIAEIREIRALHGR